MKGLVAHVQGILYAPGQYNSSVIRFLRTLPGTRGDQIGDLGYLRGEKPVTDGDLRCESTLPVGTPLHMEGRNGFGLYVLLALFLGVCVFTRGGTSTREEVLYAK